MKNLSIKVDKSRSMMDSRESVVKKDSYVSSLSNSAASCSNSLQSSPIVRSRFHSVSSPGLGITALLHDDAKFSSREGNRTSTATLQSTTSPTASGILNLVNSTAPERLLSRNHLFNTTSKVTPPLPPPLPRLQSTHPLPTATEPMCTHLLSASGLSDSNSLTTKSLSSSSIHISKLQPSPPSPPPVQLTQSSPAELPLERQSPRQLSDSQLSDSNSLTSESLSSSSMQISKPILSPPPPPPPSPPPFMPDSNLSATKLPKTFPPPLQQITWTPSVDQSPTNDLPLLKEQSEPSTNQSSPSSSLFPVPYSSSSTVTLPLQNIQSAPFPSPLPPSEKTEFPFPRTLSSFASPPPPPPPPPPRLPSPLSEIVSIPSLGSVVPAPPPTPSLRDFSNICKDPSLLPSKKMGVPATPPPPPPPRLKSNAVSAARCLVPPPPPPPPPSCIQDKALTRSGQSVPPPPAPLVNGIVKAGGTMQMSQSINTGNIPAPPQGTKCKFQSRSSTKVPAQPRKTSLKPYHWLKLTRALHGSIWAEAQKPEEASKAPELDMSELESLFSAAIPNSDHGGKINRRGSRIKSEKIQLIELRRAYNCEIMLKKVKVPLPDLMNSVLALDDLALDSDQVDNLIKFCPTKEEIDLLKNYKGDKDNLGTCEQFFMELMKVPRVESKLRVFSFKIQFWSQVSYLRNSLKIVDSASEEVRRSVKLRRIMQTILSLGNALNHGTAKGSAVGFRLDSLPKLAETRARNNKLTLMHYLCKVLAKNLPEVLDFEKDFINLEASSKIQLKYLAEEMLAVTKGLEKVAQELTASENDGHASEHFCQTLKEFLGSAEAEVQSLASLYSGAGRNADALALYFGEDPARCPFEQVVSTLLNFVRMFRLAHKENCQQIEFDNKKAYKEVENDKAKLNASEKELQNENAKASAAKISKLMQSQN